MPDLNQWHYFKLYVGSRHDALDRLITDGLEETLAAVREYPWFYLRYIDEKGVHLRFRVSLPAKAKLSPTALFSLLHDGLAAIASAPYGSYQPLVSVVGQQPFVDNEERPAFCETATYEPENDKFGGEAGIAIAEPLFCRSSVLARRILLLEQAGKLNRKDLVLPFFMTALQTFVKPGERQAFLERYANFWLSGNPAIGAYKIAFAEQAYTLLESERPLLPDTTPPLQSELTAEWQAMLTAAYNDYKKLTQRFTRELIDRLAFNFIHLMNNRLGLNALDESWLATLLAKSMEMGQLNEPA